MAKFVTVTGQAVQEAAAASSNALQVPATAKRSKKDADTAYWHERLMIVKCGATTEVRDDGHEVTKIDMRFRVPKAGGSGENADREFSETGWSLDLTVYPNGDRAEKGYKNSQRTMGRITAIMRAVGVPGDLPSPNGQGLAGYSDAMLARHFPDDGISSPLLNKEFDVEIKQSFDDFFGEIRPRINKIQPNPQAAVSGTAPAGVVKLA